MLEVVEDEYIPLMTRVLSVVIKSLEDIPLSELIASTDPATIDNGSKGSR